MSNELKLYENNGTQIAVKEDNYVVTVPGGAAVELIRSHKDEKGNDLGDGDFGVIPGTNKPSLFKSGADKIRIAYGFFERHTPIVELCNFDLEESFIRHVDKCELVKLNPATGQEYVFASYVASANNKEKRNGSNTGFNADNNTVKMAEKRSMVSAVISIANLSNMFTMDVEDMKLGKAFSSIAKNLNNDPIGQTHVKKLWAEASKLHLDKDDVRKLLNSCGYESTSEIKKKDFGSFLDLMAKKITVEEFKEMRDGAKKAEDGNENEDESKEE